MWARADLTRELSTLTPAAVDTLGLPPAHAAMLADALAERLVVGG